MIGHLYLGTWHRPSGDWLGSKRLMLIGHTQNCHSTWPLCSVCPAECMGGPLFFIVNTVHKAIRRRRKEKRRNRARRWNNSWFSRLCPSQRWTAAALRPTWVVLKDQTQGDPRSCPSFQEHISAEFAWKETWKSIHVQFAKSSEGTDHFYSHCGSSPGSP